jgi:hypothetical protein
VEKALFTCGILFHYVGQNMVAQNFATLCDVSVRVQPRAFSFRTPFNIHFCTNREASPLQINLATMTSNAVQKQWEAPATGTLAFAAWDRLSALLKATSQDDVQASTVIALEKIGIRCLVNPELISRGIDALGGNESIRISETKLLFGFARGSTAFESRKSTPCVQGFLLIAALENCGLIAKEVGEIMFEILASSGDLAATPVSTQQLTKLIKVLSGYCQTVLSPDGADVIASSVEIFASLNQDLQSDAASADFWSQSSPKQWAELLLESLDAIRDDAVHHVDLVGSHGAVWVTALFLWLNREELALFHGNKIYLGKIDARIRIVLGFDAGSHTRPTTGAGEPHSWKVRTWKKGESLQSLVDPNSRMELDTLLQSRRTNNLPSLTRLPAGALRGYYQSLSNSEADVEVLGGLAAAMLHTTLTLGKIAKPGTDETRTLRDFCSAQSIYRLNTILKIFGWSPSAKSETKIRHHWTKVRDVLLQKTRSQHDLESVETIYAKYLIQYIGDPWGSARAEELMESARRIAMQALLALFVCAPASRRDSPRNDDIFDEQLLRSLPVNVKYGRNLFSGLFGQSVGLTNTKSTPPDLVNFRHCIFQFTNCGEAIPLRTGDASKVVAISGRGTTTFLAPLLHHTTTLEGLLDVILLPGDIHFDDERFELVLESPYNPVARPGSVETYFQTVETINVSNKKPNPDPNIGKVTYLFHKDDTALEMESKVCISGGWEETRTYCNSIEMIAFATHFGRQDALLVPDTTEALQEAVANAYEEAERLYPRSAQGFEYLQPFRYAQMLHLDGTPSPSRTWILWLTLTSPAPLASGHFFGASEEADPQGWKLYRTFMQQDCSIKQCLVLALRQTTEDMKSDERRKYLKSLGLAMYGIKIVTNFECW